MLSLKDIHFTAYMLRLISILTIYQYLSKDAEKTNVSSFEHMYVMFYPLF